MGPTNRGLSHNQALVHHPRTANKKTTVNYGFTMSSDSKPDKTTDEKLKKEESKNDEQKDNIRAEKVHSANSWENANLGDDDRKKKFLRLMGAGKKEHHGKIVIGDHESGHARSEKDTQRVNEALEEQYKQGLEHKLVGGYKGHMGLGFHEEQEKDKAESTAKEGEITAEKSSENKDGEKESLPQKHKSEDDEGSSNGSPTGAKKMKMNFVKSSS